MKKKVVHIVLRDYIDSYSYQENLLPQKHSELGYDVYVLTSQLYRDKNNKKAFHEVKEFTNEYGVHVSILPSKSKNNITGIFLDQAIGLYDKIKQIAPDIIFTHSFGYRDMRHIVRYAKEHPHVKVFADCHTDYYNSAYNTFYGKAKAFFVRREGHILNEVALKFWGTTPWRVDFLKEVYKIPQEKIDLLVLGAEEKNIENVDPLQKRKEVREKYAIPEDAFLIITGGKLDKRKQQNLLMEAVKQLDKENVWLLTFGTPSEEMKEVFKTYEDTDNIIMTGWMSSKDTYSLFLASDLAFFPGTHSVLWEEAVACSVPLVVKHWKGMEHVNVNGNALLLDKVTIESIIDTIRQLKFTQKYLSMLSNAKQSAHTFFIKNIALKAIGEDE